MAGNIIGPRTLGNDMRVPGNLAPKIAEGLKFGTPAYTLMQSDPSLRLTAETIAYYRQQNEQPPVTITDVRPFAAGQHLGNFALLRGHNPMDPVILITSSRLYPNTQMGPSITLATAPTLDEANKLVGLMLQIRDAELITKALRADEPRPAGIYPDYNQPKSFDIALQSLTLDLQVIEMRNNEAMRGRHLSGAPLESATSAAEKHISVRSPGIPIGSNAIQKSVYMSTVSYRSTPASKSQKFTITTYQPFLDSEITMLTNAFEAIARFGGTERDMTYYLHSLNSQYWNTEALIEKVREDSKNPHLFIFQRGTALEQGAAQRFAFADTAVVVPPAQIPAKSPALLARG